MRLRQHPGRHLTWVWLLQHQRAQGQIGMHVMLDCLQFAQLRTSLQYSRSDQV